MTDDPRPNPQPRWVHQQGAADYLDLELSTFVKKLIDGTGPRFYLAPGSRNKIFWTPDLDAWVMTTPERPVTEGEIRRLEKLQAGARRVREERRARRQPAEIDEEANA
jgi:hypothetical protein